MKSLKNHLIICEKFAILVIIHSYRTYKRLVKSLADYSSVLYACYDRFKTQFVHIIRMKSSSALKYTIRDFLYIHVFNKLKQTFTLVSDSFYTNDSNDIQQIIVILMNTCSYIMFT